MRPQKLLRQAFNLVIQVKTPKGLNPDLANNSGLEWTPKLRSLGGRIKQTKTLLRQWEETWSVKETKCELFCSLNTHYSEYFNISPSRDKYNPWYFSGGEKKDNHRTVFNEWGKNKHLLQVYKPVMVQSPTEIAVNWIEGKRKQGRKSKHKILSIRFLKNSWWDRKTFDCELCL